MIKVKKFEQAAELLLGTWESDETKLVFKKDGTIDYMEKGIKESLTWDLDPSGHLVVLTKKDGSKLYAVHNLVREKNRLGFEFSNGRFKDLVRVKK